MHMKPANKELRGKQVRVLRGPRRCKGRVSAGCHWEPGAAEVLRIRNPGKAAGAVTPEPEDLLEMAGKPAENRHVQKSLQK